MPRTKATSKTDVKKSMRTPRLDESLPHGRHSSASLAAAREVRARLARSGSRLVG